MKFESKQLDKKVWLSKNNIAVFVDGKYETENEDHIKIIKKAKGVTFKEVKAK